MGLVFFVYWHCLFHENKMKHWLNGIKTVLQKSKYRSLIKCFKKVVKFRLGKKVEGIHFFLTFVVYSVHQWSKKKKSVKCISMPDLVNDPSVMVKSLNCSLVLCFNLLISDKNNTIRNTHRASVPDAQPAPQLQSPTPTFCLYCFSGHFLAQLKHWWSWHMLHTVSAQNFILNGNKMWTGPWFHHC